MRLSVIRKKASSQRELGRESIDIAEVSTLEELLCEMTAAEMKKYPDRNTGTLEHAVQVMIQDFEDGLFRVYLNGEECKDLKERLDVKDGDEIVLIRFIMLAGRMW